VAPQARSSAIIEDLGQGSSQAVYFVGDTVQQATIAEIRPDCVVFDRNSRREELCFERDAGANTQMQSAAPAARGRLAATPPTASASRQRDAGNPGGVVRVDAHTWQISRELLLENFSNLGSLSQQAQFVPNMVQGQQRGFRVTQLKGGSLLQQIGLQNGDVLQKVNGMDIQSPQDMMQTYQQLQSEATMRLEVLRGNRPTTLNYEIR
jgi:general secretion pathway protein C